MTRGDREAEPDHRPVEHHTAALRDILQVISQSRGDEQRVFDAILKHACALCNAPLGGLILGAKTDAAQRMAAHIGQFPEVLELFDIGQMRMDGNLSYAARSIIEARLVAFDDMGQSDLYRSGSPIVRAMVDDSGIRSVLFVPLLQGAQAIGTITLFRYDLDPFRPDEIALVEAFAAQAVIAIENAQQFRALQSQADQGAVSREILETIAHLEGSETPVFEKILEAAAAFCGSDNAGLALATADRSSFYIAAGWGERNFPFRYDQTWPLTDPQPVPTVIRTGTLVNIANLEDTALFKAGDPVITRIVEASGNRSWLVVPLKKDGLAIGALSLSRQAIQEFTTSDIALVESFAAQAVIAIENVRQFRALEVLNAELGDRVQAQVGEIERMGRLKRFLPPAVADTVVSSGSEKMLQSHRALLGILFCDIRGFTAFCKSAEPEETIEVLQTYHEEMGKLIVAHGAGVDHRMGDGIMVLFNDPVPCDDPAGDAVRLAMAMRDRMAELCKGWKRLGHRLGFGVGVSLGYATVGMVGYEGRFDYTASGTAVNLAARLCDQAEDGEILLSPRAQVAVEDDMETAPHAELALKGINAPVEVFRLIGARAS